MDDPALQSELNSLRASIIPDQHKLLWRGIGLKYFTLGHFLNLTTHLTPGEHGVDGHTV